MTRMKLTAVLVCAVLGGAAIAAVTYTRDGVITYSRSGVHAMTSSAISVGDGVVHTMTYNRLNGRYEHCQYTEQPVGLPLCFEGFASPGWTDIDGSPATDGGVHWLFSNTDTNAVVVWSFFAPIEPILENTQ